MYDNRHVCEDVRVVNMTPDIHSAGSLYKLMSTYWMIGLFRTMWMI